MPGKPKSWLFECKSKIRWFSTDTTSCQILYIMLFRILTINNPWDILSRDLSLAPHILPMHCSFNHIRVTFPDHASDTALIYVAPSIHCCLIFARSSQVRWGGAQVRDMPTMRRVLVCIYIEWVSGQRWEIFVFLGDEWNFSLIFT